MFSVLFKYREIMNEYLTWATAVEETVDGIVVHQGDDKHSHFARSNTSEDVRDVFVMNDQGQTVARYVL